jgi:hypothetical protein
LSDKLIEGKRIFSRIWLTKLATRSRAGSKKNMESGSRKQSLNKINLDDEKEKGDLDEDGMENQTMF